MRHLLAFLMLALLLSGCSIRRVGIRAVTPVLDDFVTALFAEPDLLLARTAFESDIKMIEGLRLSADSPRLRELHAMALTGYALIYCEGVDDARASRFYRRAHHVGLALLGSDPFALSQPEFDAWLAAVPAKQQSALFWTAFPYGAWMALNLAESEAVFRLPRVEAMIARASALDPDYFFGAGQLFEGAITCVKPRFVGGKPETGQALFQQAAAGPAHGLLLPLFFEARYYCPAALDEERFDQIQQEAASFDFDARPELRLLNQWAWEQILLLNTKRSDLF
ncbi:MAG: hypothetical protein H6678_09565 [Candidatus Delongbacteria bacterium]|nr:hypothetical protein [Candidatus Delongbacteria bacterium]